MVHSLDACLREQGDELLGFVVLHLTMLDGSSAKVVVQLHRLDGGHTLFILVTGSECA